MNDFYIEEKLYGFCIKDSKGHIYARGSEKEELINYWRNFISSLNKITSEDGFLFSGNPDFFNPPRYITNLDDDAVPIENIIKYAYRMGFAKGCNAGANDLIKYLNKTGQDVIMDHEKVFDAFRIMEECVPSPYDKDQEVSPIFQPLEVQPKKEILDKITTLLKKPETDEDIINIEQIKEE